MISPRDWAIIAEDVILLGLSVYSFVMALKIRRTYKRASQCYTDAAQHLGAAQQSHQSAMVMQDMASKRLQAAGIAVAVIEALNGEHPPETMQ